MARTARPAYKLLRGSRGPRREFKITLGLRAGYGPRGRIYDLEEAVRVAHEWMLGRARRGAVFLTGMFARGEVLYARAGGRGAAGDREPVAMFSGEALPQASRQLDDATVEALLDELAATMAQSLDQQEVHIAYRERVWTLRRARI